MAVTRSGKNSGIGQSSEFLLNIANAYVEAPNGVSEVEALLRGAKEEP
jgi:hypothetical protein